MSPFIDERWYPRVYRKSCELLDVACRTFSVACLSGWLTKAGCCFGRCVAPDSVPNDFVSHQWTAKSFGTETCEGKFAGVSFLIVSTNRISMQCWMFPSSVRREGRGTSSIRHSLFNIPRHCVGFRPPSCVRRRALARLTEASRFPVAG